jgi:hypothetical protein
MRAKAYFFLAAILAVASSASPALAAEVAQGRCIEFDKEKMRVVIEEYDTNFGPEHPYGRPTQAKSAYDLGRAQLGIPPKPGDILRIAYEVRGTERVAIKVMNVSQQDLMKK